MSQGTGTLTELTWLITRTAVFFENTMEGKLGIISRPWFEAKLNEHFKTPSQNDVSWYALRNTVFAFGCRIEMAKTSSYSEVAKVSSSFLNNALSVQTAMLYQHSTLTCVKALVLMVRARHHFTSD